MASNVASYKELKKNSLEAAEKIEASTAGLLEVAPSKSSKLVVNNDRVDATNPVQEELNNENNEKRDRIPNSLLKPEEAADGNCTLKFSGTELIGRTVRIWWPEEKRFYRGKIKYFNADERLHMVDYDNGIKEFLDLKEERWLLEKQRDSGFGASKTVLESVAMSSSHNSKRKHMDAACQDVTTQQGEKKKVTKKELNLDEDQAIHEKTAAADPKMISQSPEHQKHQKTLADPPAVSVQDGSADAYNKLVNVSGYLVKASIASILQSIFSKYGDIASNCVFKHQNTRSLFLEVVCNVVKRLRSTEFGVSNSEAKEMMSEISDAAKANLDVSWLRKFLEEINEVEEVHNSSSGLMELRANSSLIVIAARKDMEDRRMEAMAAKKQFVEAKSRWKALEHVKAKIENDVVEFLAPKRAWKRKVHQLLP